MHKTPTREQLEVITLSALNFRVATAPYDAFATTLTTLPTVGELQE